MLFKLSLDGLRKFIREKQGIEINTKIDSTGVLDTIEKRILEMPFGILKFDVVTYGGCPRITRRHFFMGEDRIYLLSHCNHIASLYGPGNLAIKFSPFSKKYVRNMGQEEYTAHFKRTFGLPK